MRKLKVFLYVFLILYGVYLIFPYFIKIDIKEIPESTIIYDEENNEL
jgi:hypothetical protein